MYRQFWLATLKYESPKRFGYDWFYSALDKIWESKIRQIDWLDYEQMSVDILKSEELTAKQKVSLLKQALDCYTRRGHFLES